MEGLKNKVVIVINGKGGSGKDAVCNIVAKRYKVTTISAITPIKNVAAVAGWNGEKDDKSRKMLSDLKMLFIEYNDLPYKYIMGEIDKFLASENEIMFIHCREKSEIDKVIRGAPVKVYTLLIKRTDEFFVQREYGNASDDLVESYDYDFRYVGNNKTKLDLEKSFNEYFDTVMLPVFMAAEAE